MATEVKGALAFRKALRKFAPDLAKETTREIANFIKPVTRKAKGFMPSNDEMPSGWLKRENAGGRWATRYYDASEARRGITYKTSPTKPNARGWVSIATMYNKSLGGIIYEWAGRTSGIQGNFTPKLPEAKSLKGKNKGMTGRALYRAYYEDQGKARANVIKAIEKAAAKFNARSRA